MTSQYPSNHTNNATQMSDSRLLKIIMSKVRASINDSYTRTSVDITLRGLTRFIADLQSVLDIAQI